MSSEYFMSLAIHEAELAFLNNEVPVGAIVTDPYHNVIAKAYNRIMVNNDPCGHAEILALKSAAAYLNNYRLNECSIYVTSEPCLMCFGAILHARIDYLYFGASSPLYGAMSYYHIPLTRIKLRVTGGIMTDKASALLKAFFAQRRFSAQKPKAG